MKANPLNILKFCMYKSRSLRMVVNNIKQIPRNLKFAWQRIKWGFCEGDTWNLDHYLASVIADSVAYLRDHHMGYVDRLYIGEEIIEMDDKQYTEYLDQIVKYFDIVRRDDMDLKEDEQYDFDTYAEARSFQEECLHKGFEMLERIWWGLWD